MGAAIVAPMSIEASDGTCLEAPHDLALAWKWAEHEHGPAEWSAMAYGERVASVSAALAELRRAYSEAI